MPATVSLHRVLQTIEDAKTVCWRLKDSAEKDLIAEQQDIRYTVKQSQEALQEAMKDVEDPILCIYLHVNSAEKITKQGGNQTREGYKFKIRNPLTGTVETKSMQGISGMPSQFELMQQVTGLQIEMAGMKHQAAMDQLRAEMKEEKNPVIEGIMPMIQQLIPALIQQFTGAGSRPVVGIAGHGSAAVAEPPAQPMPSPEMQRLRAAVAALKAADPEYIETIELIAKYAAAKPDQYKTFKPLVRSQI